MDIDDTEYLRSRREATLLGLSYLLVGLGLVVSFAIDSTVFFVGVLLAILAVTGVSLYVIFREEGVRTRDNLVIAGCVVISICLLFGLYGLTNLSTEIVFALVIIVGVLLPKVLLKRTSLGTE